MIYRIDVKVVTDLLPSLLTFVDFVIERDKALLLEHEEKGVFYLSLLFHCRRRDRVNVSLFFHDVELDYIYRLNKELEPPVTAQIPAHFDYPFHHEHPLMVLITVTELDTIKPSLSS